MLNKIVMTALLAGLVAGLFVGAAQMVRTVPLIIYAEQFENGEVGEEAPAAAPATPVAAHDHASHDHGAVQVAPVQTEVSDGHSHSHDGDDWMPEDGLERTFYTFLSSVLLGVGMASILVGGIVLSHRRVDFKEGIIWGLCGFAAFYLAPSFGLPPEMPGMMAADVIERQIWWIGTAIATAAGFALVFFVPAHWAKAVAVFLIVVPHVIGAPHVEVEPGLIPAELAAEYTVASLVTVGLFWVMLGGLTGYFYDRFGLGEGRA